MYKTLEFKIRMQYFGPSLIFLCLFSNCTILNKKQSKKQINFSELKFTELVKNIGIIELDSVKFIDTKVYKLDSLFKIETYRIQNKDTQLVDFIKSENTIYFYRRFYSKNYSDYYDGMNLNIIGEKGYFFSPGRCRPLTLPIIDDIVIFEQELEKLILKLESQEGDLK